MLKVKVIHVQEWKEEARKRAEQVALNMSNKAFQSIKKTGGKLELYGFSNPTLKLNLDK